ncbi:hypothetical protein BaRGS_00022541 [Batillaria attramentaria]|uniref:DNA/RNA-binding protein Alba-like domain-containing protein n=1 Tax=Batillaria attramentaria TaxID=370345 RepID=A0ABD0KG51_9CAEN
MENYTKGATTEVDDPYPFADVDDALQMRVTQGSKIRNLMGFAMKRMTDKETRQIAWNGSGFAVTKTITCAEIMKRKIKGLHQNTKIRFRRIEEHWEPKTDGLETLKVNRDIPAISILLSKDPLDVTEPGYQPPGNFESFWQEKKSTDRGSRNRPKSSQSAAKVQELREQATKQKRKRSRKDGGDLQASQSQRQGQLQRSQTVDTASGGAFDLPHEQMDSSVDTDSKEAR